MSRFVRSRAELDRPWQYPFYLKLAHSTAGGGVFHIENRGELDRRLDEVERKGLFGNGSEALVQQPARGVLSTVQAVFNQGEMIGVHCFEARRLGVGGMSTARTSADHPVVRQQVARIGRHLNWHGALFIDYFYEHESGRPEYIECNPRIGETVNAMVSGVNLPKLVVQISNGESPSPVPLSRFGVRTHNLFMTLMSMAYEGQGRAALVREMQECARGRGLYEHGEDDLTRPQEDPLSRVPRFWMTSQLLAWPGVAKRIVAKTVENYSLPESATAAIKALPLDLLDVALLRHSRFMSRTACSKPDHDRSGDDAVADVQLVHAVDGGDRFHVAVSQAVAGVEREAGGSHMLSGRDQAVQFGLDLRLLVPRRCDGIGTGVQLDRIGAESLRRPAIWPRSGSRNKAHDDAGVLESADRVAYFSARADDIEPALGRHFFAAFWHERGLIGGCVAGDWQHVVRRTPAPG